MGQMLEAYDFTKENELLNNDISNEIQQRIHPIVLQ